MDKPPPPEEQVDPFTVRGIAYLVAGLIAYGAGFALLARDQPDFAPVVIIAGIVAMFWAFIV